MADQNQDSLLVDVLEVIDDLAEVKQQELALLRRLRTAVRRLQTEDGQLRTRETEPWEKPVLRLKQAAAYLAEEYGWASGRVSRIRFEGHHAQAFQKRGRAVWVDVAKLYEMETGCPLGPPLSAQESDQESDSEAA